MESLATPVFSLVSPSTPRPRKGSAPLGTGPYRVERLVSGRSVTLVRNPYFRARGPEGQAPGFADRVEVTLGDTAARVAAAAAGRLDLAPMDPSELPPAQFAALRARLGTRLQSGPLPATLYVWLNNRRPPFDDVRVRRAVNLAIDRARVVATLGGPELHSPTCQLLPPGLPGYRPVCTFTASPSAAGVWKAPDLTEAKRLVAAAGVRGTHVAMWTWQGFEPTARDVVRTLRQLGFRTRLRLIDPAREEMPSDPRHFPQVGFIGWGADSTDPAAFLRTLISCAGYDARAPAHGSNLSGFCDPRLDAAIDRAAAAGPADGAAWEQIERRIARAAPLVPLYNGRVLVATSARTGNVELNPFRYFMLDRIWVR
jgi:peptide/nickel transport system substrate-binding protein